jgi:hypothetical protein
MPKLGRRIAMHDHIMDDPNLKFKAQASLINDLKLLVGVREPHLSTIVGTFLSRTDTVGEFGIATRSGLENPDLYAKLHYDML